MRVLQLVDDRGFLESQASSPMLPTGVPLKGGAPRSTGAIVFALRASVAQHRLCVSGSSRAVLSRRVPAQDGA